MQGLVQYGRQMLTSNLNPQLKTYTARSVLCLMLLSSAFVYLIAFKYL